uniref:hypothetical protein n=1 Tax=Thiolapillus sp. TaxID=2017437 RepID=UPI003AF8552A
MALCFLQVLREPVVQYLAGSEQRTAPFWNIITWYPTFENLTLIMGDVMAQIESVRPRIKDELSG